MAFIILLQTLYKNCGNLRVLIAQNFIYSHDKNKEKIKNFRVNSTLYFFVNQKNNNNNKFTPTAWWQFL